MDAVSRASRPPLWGWSVLSPQSKRALFVIVIASLFLATHLPFVAPGAGSIDSMNFALAVRHFDISDHRPHPPGYPVFVALAKITRALVASSSVEADTVVYEARALALWSALFGALAAFPLFKIFRCLELDDRRAAAATALTMTCPLFWFLAIRPMSDVPGLGAALIAQAMVFSAYRRQEQCDGRSAMRLLLAGAVVSGLAVGLRSQALWLTLPLLAAVTFRQARRTGGRSLRPLIAVASAFVFGAAIWGVPLMAASGGPRSYFAAFASQAGEDFADVDLLVRHPSLGRLFTGLVSTFAYPWANKFLAPVVLLLAVLGAAAMTLKARAVVWWLALAAGPYTAFHLLYQDPGFTRYALPAVPVVAYLAVRGLDVLASRRLPWLTAALAAGCIAVAGSPVVAYATLGGPGYQAVSAVRDALKHEGLRTPVIATHHEVGRAIRGEHFSTVELPFPRGHEWLELVRYWREGGSAPIWFLADSGRTDLALIDPWAQRLRGAFRLPFTNRFFMRGARPAGVNWYELRPPGWIAGEGWALTPETAGVAWRDAKGPAHRPITAWIRRRPEAAVMMIGGRNLGQCGEPDIRFDATLDGRALDAWVAGPQPGFFLRQIDLPGGFLDGAGQYAELRLSARSADGVIRSVSAAIEQFDVQSADRAVYGFDSGWYQLEYDAAAKKLWRWTGPWAALRVHHGGRDLTLRVVGDSPLKYVDRVPTITVRVGNRVLGRLTPSDEFVFTAHVPADALAAADGTLILETNVTFVPDDRLHNGDRRPLGLRIFEMSLF